MYANKREIQQNTQEIILKHISCEQVGNLLTIWGCPGSDLSSIKENEDNVWQTLMYDIDELLFQGALTVGILVAMLQQSDGPNTVKVVFLKVMT